MSTADVQEAGVARLLPTTVAWHAATTDQVVATLDTNLELGLSSLQAAQRLTEYGANKLGEATERVSL